MDIVVKKEEAKSGGDDALEWKNMPLNMRHYVLSFVGCSPDVLLGFGWADAAAFPVWVIKMATRVESTKVFESVAFLLESEKLKPNRNDALVSACHRGIHELVEVLVPSCDLAWKDHEALELATKMGHRKVIEMLVAAGADVKSKDSHALRWVAYHGYPDLLEKLMPSSDVAASDSIALRYAAHKGHTECVKLLLPKSDPLASNSEALRLASRFGHTGVVEALKDVSKVDHNKDEALRLAARFGHEAIVALLAPKVSAGEGLDEAIELAKHFGHASIAATLEAAKAA